MKKTSTTPAKPHPTTVTLHLPVLDDTTAVMIYNVLCELVDRFDVHYGEQICHFYAQQNATDTTPPPTDPDHPPF